MYKENIYVHTNFGSDPEWSPSPPAAIGPDRRTFPTAWAGGLGHAPLLPLESLSVLGSIILPNRIVLLRPLRVLIVFGEWCDWFKEEEVCRCGCLLCRAWPLLLCGAWDGGDDSESVNTEGEDDDDDDDTEWEEFLRLEEGVDGVLSSWWLRHCSRFRLISTTLLPIPGTEVKSWMLLNPPVACKEFISDIYQICHSTQGIDKQTPATFTDHTKKLFLDFNTQQTKVKSTLYIHVHLYMYFTSLFEILRLII